MTRAHCGPTIVPLTYLLQFATGRRTKHTIVNTIFSFCEQHCVGQGQCVCSPKKLCSSKIKSLHKLQVIQCHFPNSTSHACPNTSTIDFKILLLTFNPAHPGLPSTPCFALCRRQPDFNPPLCHRPLECILTC